ncbi:MAG: hypothetical protein ACK5QX_03345 [bacterium]|jgi:hypothetical protein|nr:hypothetical protein [Cytophagales bacterium]MCA6417339.1 hypothetical protein [Cytophagales bacterium]MCA6427426.1 hypothetical protein [Cytophagales bacterium]
MKTQDEILHRLEQAAQEYESVKEWHDEAWKRYQDDKKNSGKDQADSGEVDHSGAELAKIRREISVLKWCLEHETSNAPIE